MVIYTALQRIIFSLYANTDLSTDRRTDRQTISCIILCLIKHNVRLVDYVTVRADM